MEMDNYDVALDVTKWILSFLDLWMSNYPENPNHVFGDHKPSEVIDSLGSAFQRAVCYQTMDEDETGTIISLSLRIVRYVEFIDHIYGTSRLTIQ